MEKRSRCKTGIELLEKLQNEGITQGNILLISGGTGLRKTTLSMEFLANGAREWVTKVFFLLQQKISKIKKYQGSYNFVD
jgi:KaiC/GvpD/RAD55 family RecA-like ATPase